jgi:Zn-finger nucleic acid-binding protein
MNCPVCDGARMREVQKNDVMLDVCPNCKGVWLDRGELEKLMQDIREVRQDYNEWYYKEEGKQSHDRGGYSNQGDSHHGHSKHKKKSVLDRLGDLFD